MNNNIYNLTYTKKDIKKLLLTTFIMYAICVFPCRNFIVSLVIVLIASAILISMYIFITSKIIIDEIKVMKICGSIGLFNSFIFSLLTAYQKGKTFVDMLITFTIIMGIIIGIIIILEIISRRTSIWENNKKVAVSGTIISFFVLLGIITSRFALKNGIEIKIEFIFGSFSIIFSLFYGAFIKAREYEQLSDEFFD